MARPKLEFGLFRLKPGVRPYEIDGDVMEKFADLRAGHERLAQHREAAKQSGANPYDIVVLPLGPKGEGLLGPGV